MHEVVLRRYRKLLEQGGPFPDLILIDGGKGQLSAAYAALEELGLANLVAVGIAKKEELLFTRDRDEPIALAANDPALLLVQRIRDEAHRFAVTFHRRARTMRDLRSELDDVPGIGPRRRRVLLTHVRQPRRRPPRDARGAGGRRRRESRRRRSCVFRESAVTCYSLLGHQLRADLHRVHRSAVFPDRARDGACVDGGSARRSDGAAARPRLAQPDGARRSDRHGAVSADCAGDRRAADRLGEAGAGERAAACGTIAAITCWSRPPVRPAIWCLRWSPRSCWRCCRSRRMTLGEPNVSVPLAAHPEPARCGSTCCSRCST